MEEEYRRQLNLIEVYTREIEENYDDKIFDVEFWAEEIYEVVRYLRQLGDRTFEMIRKGENE